MLALIISVLLPIVLLFLWHNSKRGKKIPPGPFGLPLIGNLLEIDKYAPQIYLWRLAQKYGPIMTLRFGSRPVLVISSAKLAKEVLRTHDRIFCSRPSLLVQQKLSYNGLDIAFSPYNDYWREIRKICVVHLFNNKKVQSSRPIREDEVSRLITKVSKLSSTSEIVNLSELLISMTSAITCRVAFGKRYDYEGQERSRFHDLLNETQAVLGSFYFSDYVPVLRWVDKVNGTIARLEKNFREMDSFYEELINDHLISTRPEWMQDDFLDILLTLKRDHRTPFDITSYDHIKGVIMNVIVGGTETGAATVVWVMSALMKNPIAITKVQEEVRNLDAKREILDEDDIKDLPYLAAVVKEAMRLYPAVPLLLPRETMDKFILDGFEIPSKTIVYVNAWAIGRDPEVWESPEEFIPERFLNSTIDFRGQDFELIPFGAGRRVCPGLNMGIANVELVLANLLYSFDWEMPVGMKAEDIVMETKPGLVMHKRHDLCLLAKKYKL